MDDQTKAVLMDAGAQAITEQRKAKGEPEFPADPIVIQRSADLLRKAGER